jgi:hypothetical protein
MHDGLIAVMFMVMVFSPCLVAASTGVHTGSDTGVLDSAELEELESRHNYIPGSRAR